MHDAVAVAHVIRAGLVETADRGVVVDCGGELSRGRTYVDLWGRAGWAPNAHVAVDIDAQGFVDFLVERLGDPRVMSFGVLTLQLTPWTELVERWRHLEELGIETIWVADHLAPGESTWFEAWSCITALACETSSPGSARSSAR